MQQISRSAIETLFECEYKRYFNYDYDKQGIVSTRSLFDTDLGIALHDALYEVVMSEGEWQYQDRAELSQEDNTLIHGHVLTFKKDILPVLLAEYDVVSLEQEWAIPLGPYNLAMRMDAILRHKTTGQLEIIDYKTKKALGWIKDSQYKFNLQTALYTWALEEKTQEEIRGITYIIFEKGEVKLDKSKTFEHRIRNSPYCYGYKSPHGAYQSGWAKGWTKFATWTEFDIEKWTYGVMDAEDRAKTFLFLPQLQLDKNVRKKMIDNAISKEIYYRSIVDNPAPQMDKVLHRNHQACNKFGTEHQCPYFGMCWYDINPTKEEFTERIDHHGEKED